MIEAKQLRIGNKILFDSDIDTVTSIFSKGVDGEFKSRWWFDRLHSIPLTPEILEKCGFNIDASYDVPKIQKGNFILHGYENEFGANFGIIERLDVSVKYLHQLQNLYYALTGTELEVKF